MHELGHWLGFDDQAPDQPPHELMTATLPTGVRRFPSSSGDSPLSHSLNGVKASLHHQPWTDGFGSVPLRAIDAVSVDDFFSAIPKSRDLLPFA